MKQAFAPLALLCVLVGCSSRPAYRPFDGSVGFSEAPIGRDVYSVTYAGASNMSAGQATWLATVRAAELAFEQGKPWFDIAETRADTITRTEQTAPYTQIDRHYGRDGRERTSVYSHPGYTTTNSSPVVTLRVDLRDTPGDRSMKTDDVLANAVTRGTPLGPTAAARFGLPPVK
jgi:hypothetical protein